MTPEEAILFINSFIEAAMSQGMIKNFTTLDKLREATATLNNIVNSKK
jgi:hypothetical protein